MLVAAACGVTAAAMREPASSGAAVAAAPNATPSALVGETRSASARFAQVQRADGGAVQWMASGVGRFDVGRAVSHSARAAAAPTGFTCVAGVTRHVSQTPRGPRTRHDIFYKGTTLCSNFPRMTPLVVRQTGRAVLQVLPFQTIVDYGESYVRRSAAAVSTGLYSTYSNPRLRGHFNAYFSAPPGGRWEAGIAGCNPIFGGAVLHCIRDTAEFRPAKP
jgi:hypothetical protein